MTDAIKDYVERKISKAVEKYESQVKEVDVNLSVRGGDTGTKGDRYVPRGKSYSGHELYSLFFIGFILLELTLFAL